MGTLYEKYRAEINKWDWENIIASAQENPQEADDFMGDGGTYGSEYIGSILSLSPSGKYYTPWANSNVDLCPMCHGKTKVKNKHSDPAKYADVTAAIQMLREYGMANFPQYTAWPSELIGQIDAQRKIEQQVQPEFSCPRCGGLGSYEAYQDQEYWQALEDVASAHGGYIEQGEGDPLDTFFCITIDNPEDEEDDDEETVETLESEE